MTRFIPIILTIAVIALIVEAYKKGRDDALISELKVYQSNLTQIQHWQTNYPPELKEYIKGRYYYLANSVPKGWRPNRDYGPVATNVTSLSVGKGPTTAQVEYQKFKTSLGK